MMMELVYCRSSISFVREGLAVEAIEVELQEPRAEAAQWSCRSVWLLGQRMRGSSDSEDEVAVEAAGVETIGLGVLGVL